MLLKVLVFSYVPDVGNNPSVINKTRTKLENYPPCKIVKCEQQATYNTNENSSDKLWIDASTKYLNFKGVTKVDLNALTFSGDDVNNVSIAGTTFTLTNGKILKGAATTPSGMPADSIVFEVKLSNDVYPAAYGYDRYRVSGYRYTGLVNDEDY